MLLRSGPLSTTLSMICWRIGSRTTVVCANASPSGMRSRLDRRMVVSAGAYCVRGRSDEEHAVLFRVDRRGTRRARGALAVGHQHAAVPPHANRGTSELAISIPFTVPCDKSPHVPAIPVEDVDGAVCPARNTSFCPKNALTWCGCPSPKSRINPRQLSSGKSGGD